MTMERDVVYYEYISAWFAWWKLILMLREQSAVVADL